MDAIAGSSSRLTFGGLSTGLDTGGLIDALLETESRPLRLLEARRSTLASQQTALQSLNTSLLTLRDAARAIDNRSTSLGGPAPAEEFLAFLATSGDESILEVEAFDDATPGSFQVRVDALATSARRVSLAYADPDAAITSQARSFSIDYGDGQNISLAVPAGATLAELRDLIHLSEDNDGSVRADVLFD